jgi:hypothetical protein
VTAKENRGRKKFDRKQRSIDSTIREGSGSINRRVLFGLNNSTYKDYDV